VKSAPQSTELSESFTERVYWASTPGPPQDQNKDDDDFEDLIIRVYEQAMTYQAVTVHEVASALQVSISLVERAVRELKDLKLVRYCKERNTLIAVSPDAAQVELVLPLESVIHEKRRELAGIHRELGRFSRLFKNHQRARQQRELVVTPRNQREVLLRLTDSIRRSSGEILAMWPVSSYETQLLEDTRRLAFEAAQRGVKLQTLYPHTARSHPKIRAHLNQNLDSGAQVCTSDDFSQFIVIVDREVAFMPDGSADSDGSMVAAVYEPVMVNLLRGFYQNIWQSSCAFEREGASHDATLDTVKTRILTMLASGFKTMS
jgi:sugar-specific transcriptional regulator TrmB